MWGGFGGFGGWVWGLVLFVGGVFGWFLLWWLGGWGFLGLWGGCVFGFFLVGFLGGLVVGGVVGAGLVWGEVVGVGWVGGVGGLYVRVVLVGGVVRF
ncbi:hypothetical protein BV410_29185, partial [Klebsiella pneumoniae]